MANWTANDIPDLSGKVVIITGANNGLGYESTKMLAQKGAHIVMAVRTVAKGESAAQEIRAAVPDADLKVMALDLASLDAVRGFAEAFNAAYDRLDVLMNNAGVMATPPLKTADGFELQFGTNHLGHFALTGLLLDVLLQTAHSRVVNVSSLAADNGQIQFDDLMWTKEYKRFDAYGQSKLANLLFTLSLQKRFEEAGIDTIAVAAHPGVATTNLINSMQIPIPGMKQFINFISGFMMPAADEGALSQVRASVADDVQGGDYYGPENKMRGWPAKTPMPPQATLETAEKLWEASEKLTGITYKMPIKA